MGGGGSVQQSPAEASQANLAMRQWNDYKSRFLPLEQKFAQQTLDSNRRRGVELGAANAGAMQMAGSTEHNINAKLEAGGINPNSGAFAVANRSSIPSSALTGALAKQGMTSREHYLQRLQSAIQVGRGMQATADQGYATRAGLAESQNAAKTELQNQVAGNEMQAAGAIAGTATRGYQDWTATPSGGQSGWDAYSAARNKGDGFFQSLGTGKQQIYNNQAQTNVGFSL